MADFVLHARNLVLGALLALGCANPAETKQPPPTPQATSHRLALENFVTHFSVTVERAADLIAEGAAPAVQRDTVLWKMRAIPAARRTLRRADEGAVLLDLWLLCVRSTTALDPSQGGQDHFGDGTPIALEAMQRLVQAIQTLGRSILDERHFAAAQETVTSYAAANTFGDHLHSTKDESSGWNQALGHVLGRPIHAVTRPLNYVDPTAGLSQAAQAATQVAATVDRTRRDLNNMPDNLRWQIELLFMELEQNTAFSAAVKSLTQVGEASASLAQTASDLPASLRTELDAFLTDLGTEQDRLQGTLQDLDQTVAGIDQTVAGIDDALGDVDSIVVSTDETARSLTTMAAAYSTLVEGVSAFMLQVDPPPDPSETPAPTSAAPVTTVATPAASSSEPAQPAPPFDINEYGEAADKLSAAARELTALVAELQVLTEPEQSTVLIDSTEQLFGSITNQVLWKGSLLALLFALVALGYRAALRRLS